jgi:hypothetical protein
MLQDADAGPQVLVYVLILVAIVMIGCWLIIL